jgi:hypothetical protein
MIKKANKVKATQTPEAASHNRLAERVNDLISVGMGDPAWRIFYYAHSMFRQPRNPIQQWGGIGMWPSGDEWWTFYAHLELPIFKNRLSWPEVLAGYPEGANVVNPICKFAFGHRIYKGFWWGSIGLWAEGNTFDPAIIGTSPGVYTNNHFWKQAQNQRGALYISGKTDGRIRSSINACVKKGIPRSAANRIVERRINVSSSIFATARKPYDQILSQGLLYQLYAPAVVKGYKIWKKNVPDEHMSNYYRTKKAAKASSWGWNIGRRDSAFPSVKLITPVLHRKYATHQVLQSIFHYLITFRGSEHQRALFCRRIKKGTFGVTNFDITTPSEYAENNYPFLKEVSTNGPLTVCDVGFNFQDFLSRQFVLAPAYGHKVYHQSMKVLPGYLGGETTGSGGSAKVIKRDNTGYPYVGGSNGDRMPTLGIDLKIPEVKEGEGAVKFIIPNNVNKSKGLQLGVGNDKLGKLKVAGVLFNTGSTFNTNPKAKDRNAFCFAGYYITFIGVQNKGLSCAIEIRKGKEVIETIPISASTSHRATAHVLQPNGTYETDNLRVYNKLTYYRRGLKGNFTFHLVPIGDQDINFTREKGYTKALRDHFNGVIKIRIEIAHLFDMRPTILDAYAFLRVSTTRGGTNHFGFGDAIGKVDSVGHDYQEARVISDNYERFGSAVNPHGAGAVPALQTYLNNNPVYEATRKFVTSNMKMVPRKNVVNYAEENGMGVLYFDRFASGMSSAGMDMFRGMGPSIDSAGWFDDHWTGKRSPHVTFVPIIVGKTYYVWSHNKNPNDDFVTYNEVEYKHKAKFVGVMDTNATDTNPSGIRDYLDGKFTVGGGRNDYVGAYELEGVRNFTPPAHESNQWMMFLTFNPYHWSMSNIWKPDIFGDQTCFLHNRCLFRAPDIEGDKSSPLRARARTAEASQMRDTFYNFNTRTHLGIGDMSTYVQAPPKFNSWKGLNAPVGGNLGWSRSCKRMTEMYQVMSVTRYFGKKGIVGDPRVNMIRVELNRKLSGENFKVSRGPYGGSYVGSPLAVFGSQPFRSDKNGIGEYVNSGKSFGGGGFQCGTNATQLRNGVKIGDYGANRDVFTDVGSMNGGYSLYGSCHPRFYFLKLIPRVSPYSQLKIDPYVQMEYYIRAMHGGYVGSENEIQFQSMLPGTDFSNTSIMQNSVDHDIESVMSAAKNNPAVTVTNADPEDVETVKP